VAAEKGIGLSTEVAPGTPATIVTDAQRLQQILNNLLSNAVKFTDKGSVTVVAAPSGHGGVTLRVQDTGIGIPEDKQQTVFEAFQQADQSTSRKYGGTGLGLSITRQLVALLSGSIELESTPGEGTTFTVRLPGKISRSAPTLPPPILPSTPSPAPRVESVPAPTTVGAIPKGQVEDDRDTASSEERTILVVEDDHRFAEILYDLAKEFGFRCVVGASAEEGLRLAAEFKPSAAILDVNLPDYSGLSVLDRLKQDTRTRHIPVHMVSVSDYAQTALELGAVGYMLKPVKREQLVHAFEQLETRLEQKMRRVLIVEDDATQLESMRLLLGTADVETVGAQTAAECLELLKSTTFDCMVLDLSLPDASGFSLLDTLSKEDRYSFPPVIVYTGRVLSPDEEQHLRRYSRSIIVKGAKSPERLLDEVTLFLHQVVSDLPAKQQKMLENLRDKDSMLEGRTILVVEDDVRNVFALTSVLEPKGARVEIARNGREALAALDGAQGRIDLVLMDVMMPEMDGLTATREIRKRPEWKKLPIIALTAKAMKNDQEECLAAGANDYMAKPLDVEQLLSLVRVWLPR
jgi:CheY-like chemotaxis protein